MDKLQQMAADVVKYADEATMRAIEETILNTGDAFGKQWPAITDVFKRIREGKATDLERAFLTMASLAIYSIDDSFEERWQGHFDALKVGKGGLN